MFRSAIGRAAALYTALFAISVVVLGLVTLAATRAAMADIADAGIRAESLALAKEYESEGLAAVIHAVRDRDLTPGALNYGVEGPGFAPIAGRLAHTRAPAGWSTLTHHGREGSPEHMRILTVDLPHGHRLLVGAETDRVEALDGVVIRAFSAALVGVVILGAAVGFALSHQVHRRLSGMSAAVEAIIDGDLARRVPMQNSGDDLDRLAATFNRMLDRISDLMDSLRQVSSDVAHDLRTPLTRLRNQLEAGLEAGDGPESKAAIAQGLGELDAILDTFSALLRIAQIEVGARRTGFRPVDIAALGAEVAETFSPSAEETGHVLSVEAPGPLWVDGDRELLTQMLVNLVENALRHTPAGARIAIRARPGEAGPVLSVVDDGPGVPRHERENVLKRFYRLEAGRSTPGSGLGLALVAAVARLHAAEIRLGDAGPGLDAQVAFGRG